jgi:8-oxo-dGTP pyrophosphatase MutT (NUDIX family)
MLRLRADALARLRAWEAPDVDQDRLRESFIAHLERHEGGVWRHGPAAHLTASVLVLDPHRSRVLLMLHAKARRWFQMGGHLEEADANLAAAALREATEECGLDVLVLHPEPVHLDRHALSSAFGPCREHLDVRFVALAPAGATATRTDESLALQWFDTVDLPGGASGDVGPLVAAALRAVG